MHLQNKIEKLKNPNFILSQTRVMVKFLPKRNFLEQDFRAFVDKILDKVFEKNIRKKEKMIKQIKILQDSQQREKGEFLKTTGIGFIEFCKHEQALAFVKFAQNNKNTIKDVLGNLPIIEFGIEDIRFLKKREKIIENMKNTQKNMQAAGSSKKQDQSKDKNRAA